MKKELYKTLDIPEGVEVSVNDEEINIKGPEGELSRKFDFGKLDVEVSGKVFKIGYRVSTKREKRMMNTIFSRVENMVRGVQEKFEYELKIASSHFPMTVKVDGNIATIKNYYGEKVDRKTSVPKNVEVQVNKDVIIIKSVDKELAGQAAANFENATKVRNRDRRIFQDGVYITKKAGKEI